MNTKYRIKRHTQKLVQYFLQKPNIAALYLFGSSTKRSNKRSRDIDIAVMFDPYDPNREGVEFLLYSADMQGIVNKEVDLVCFNQADPILRYEILKKGYLIFEGNRGARIDLAVKTMVDMEECQSFLDQGILLIREHLKKSEALCHEQPA